jgi:hypothetical protein
LAQATVPAGLLGAAEVGLPDRHPPGCFRRADRPAADGTHILYLLGHSPPALWRATISGARLTGRRQLLGSSQLGAVSW